MRINYTKAGLLSILGHVGIALLFVSSFAQITLQSTSPAEEKKEPIHSTLVDVKAVEAELLRLEKVEQQKLSAQKAEQLKLEKAKKAQEAEKQRLAALKKEVEALKKDLANQEAAKLAAIKAKEAAEKSEKEAKAKAQATAEHIAEEKKRAAQIEKEHQEQVVRDQAEKNLRAALDSQKRERILAQGIENGIRQIVDRVSGQWLKPIGLNDSLSCKLKVKVLPNGEVSHVEVLESSGQWTFDRSAEAAVKKSSPLPLPEDVSVRDRLREFTFTFKPESV